MADRADELEELRLMEERLLQERKECEILENQIKALASESGGAIGVLPASPSGEGQADAGADKAASGSGHKSRDARKAESRRPAPPAPKVAYAGSTTGTGSAVSGAHRTKHGVRDAREFMEADEAERLGGGGVTNAKGDRVVDKLAHADVLANTKMSGAVPARVLRAQQAAAAPKYRSPMYRNADVERGKAAEKRGVVISNFSRAPRFKDHNSWVPGPGQYSTHDTDFSPVVVKHADQDGRYGHTWVEQEKSKRVLAAAAAFKSGAEAGRVRDAVEAAVTEATEAGLSESEVATAAAAAEGKKVPARDYANAVRREKELQRQLTAAHRTISQLRMNMTSYQSQAREQMADLSKRLLTAKKYADSKAKKIGRWREVYDRLESANFHMQRCIKDHYPAFAGTGAAERFMEISNAAHALDDVVNTARPLMTASGDSEGGPSATEDELASAARMDDFARDFGMDMGARGGIEEEDEDGDGVGELGSSGSPLIGKKGSGASVDKMGISASDLKSFAKKTRRQSTMILSQEQRAVQMEKKLSGYKDTFGVGAEEAMETIEGVRVRSQSPKRRQTGAPGRSMSPGPTPTRGRSALDIISEEADAIVERPRGRAAAPGGKRGGASTSPGPKKTAAQKPQLRRMSTRELILPADVTADLVGQRESTMDEKLRHIFEYYCSFGDRGNVLFLSNTKFFKFVREASMLKDGKVSNADVDIVFNLVVAETGGLHGSSGAGASKTHKSGRLEYADFTQALAQLAERKYATPPAAAFRALLTEHILPLYDRLKTKATFVHDVVHVGRAEETAKFADEFLQADVLQFFNDNRVALECMFTRFAMADAPPSVHAKSWADVREAHTQMSLKMYLRWAQEFRFMPDLLSRPELIQLFKEANEGSMSDGDNTALCYPEFVEVLGMLAMFLHRNDEDCPTTLSKIEMMFFKMHERAGTRFEGDEMKLIRHVHVKVQQRLDALKKERDRSRKAESTSHMQLVSGVLKERVTR